MMERGAEVNGGDADQLSKRSTRGRRRVRGRTLLALPLMVASLVGPVAAAQAAPGDLTLLSRADGLGGAGGLSLDNKSSSFGASISASGRFVAFTSEANNLSLFDNDAVVNVFMRDMVDGSIILVCCASGSSTGAAEASISGDGRNIVFSSTDDNLSTEDNNAFNNVFVYLRAFGTTSLVSVGPGGTAADGNSSGASISADGHHVVFSSGADNLSDVDNNNNVTNVFRRGLLPGGGTTYVSRANGADGAPVPPLPLERTAISGDGNLVAFSSTAIGLSPEDTPDQQEEDVFVRDVALGTTALVSRADGVTGAGIGGTSPSFSADGRFLVFVGGRTVYRRDRLNHTTTIVSRADGPDGAPVSENFLYPSISDDGRFVAFSGRAITGTGISSDDLVDPSGNDAFSDVYVRDLLTGANTYVSRAAGAAGAAGDGDSPFASISGDGRFVAFQSNANNLSGDDTDFVPTNFIASDVFGRELGSPAAGAPAGPAPATTTPAPVATTPVAKKLSKCRKLKGRKKAACLALERALAKCAKLKGKKGKAACVKRARALAKCAELTSKKKAACVKKAKRTGAR